MGKKSETKLAERLFQMLEQESEKASSEVKEFYPNGILADCSFSSEADPLIPLLAQAKMPPDPQSPTQDQLAEQCLAIRNNIKGGGTGNIEIQFNWRRQLSERTILPLGNTVVKLLLMGSTEPKYFYIKAGSTLDGLIFLGGDNNWAIMAIKDKEGHDYFLQLAELHMLSIQENIDPRKETGLMTSYSWLTGKVFSSIITSYSLDPVKNLLLSSWLESKWQQAKAAKEQSYNEVKEGNADEQEGQKEGV